MYYSILFIIINIIIVSALDTSLLFKYAQVKYEETNEVQILSINEGTLNYIIIKSEDDDAEGIFRLGIKEKYKSYCETKCKIFAKPLKNTGVAAREIIRYLELFNTDGKSSLVKYFDGSYSTTGCVFSNTKKILSSDTTKTVPIDALFYTDTASSYTIVQNFNDVSIKFGALEEKTPLARVEWLKFISVFYGREKEATQLFNQIEENYNCNKLLVQNNQHLLTRMRVVWLSKNPESDRWETKDSLYKTELLKDAGAEILTLRENSVDSLHKVLKNVHFIIDDTEGEYGEKDVDTFYKNFKYDSDSSRKGVNFITMKNILRNDGARSSTNKSSWDEDYLVYPHLVLADLIYWFHPKLPVSKFFSFEIKDNKYDNHYWFRNLATNSPIHMTSNTKCPTALPDILTQSECINLDGYSNDYGDYSFFDDRVTRVKNYFRIYWYLISFGIIVFMGCCFGIYMYLKKNKNQLSKKLKGFSKKDIHSNSEFDEISNHQFYKLEEF